jgi:hypothetical protein
VGYTHRLVRSQQENRQSRHVPLLHPMTPQLARPIVRLLVLYEWLQVLWIRLLQAPAQNFLASGLSLSQLRRRRYATPPPRPHPAAAPGGTPRDQRKSRGRVVPHWAGGHVASRIHHRLLLLVQNSPQTGRRNLARPSLPGWYGDDRIGTLPSTMARHGAPPVEREAALVVSALCVRTGPDGWQAALPPAAGSPDRCPLSHPCCANTPAMSATRVRSRAPAWRPKWGYGLWDSQRLLRNVLIFRREL